MASGARTLPSIASWPLHLPTVTSGLNPVLLPLPILFSLLSSHTGLGRRSYGVSLPTLSLSLLQDSQGEKILLELGWGLDRSIAGDGGGSREPSLCRKTGSARKAA